jgi:hypothetical protein
MATRTSLTNYLKSTGKRKTVRNPPPTYLKRYKTQRITRFLAEPDQNTRNTDFNNFLYDRFVDEREGHEYYGLLPEDVTTESLTDVNDSDTGHASHLRGDLEYLRKIPYLRHFTEDQLLNRPLIELFGVEENNEDREYHDVDRYNDDDEPVENRVSPEHVPRHVPWQRDADPWMERMPRAPRMYGKQWLKLIEDNFAISARYIRIPTVAAPKFIDGDEPFTLEPIKPGELIVEIKHGANSVYMLRESFDDYINTPHPEQIRDVLKHPIYSYPLAGCDVRQFVQPAAPRAHQSKKPRKTSRARNVSRKMFGRQTPHRQTPHSQTPVTIDLTGSDTVDLTSSP